LTVTGFDTSQTLSLLRELLGLAEKIGDTKARVRVLEGQVRSHSHRIRLLEKARPSPVRVSSVPTVLLGRMDRLRAWGNRMSNRHNNMGFPAKFVLWATPRGLLMWGAWQGWNQTVLGWLQRIVDLW
jgi:hypothetical protein